MLGCRWEIGKRLKKRGSGRKTPPSEPALGSRSCSENYEAHGAFLQADRPAAVDHIGVASQLVFTTFCLGNFGFDQSGDKALCYGAATAHNRMMTDFCSVDRRLLATAYVPLEDFEEAEKTARAAIEMGAKALMVPSWCPQNHSPSHIGLFPVWALAQEAGLPIVFHVGGEEKVNLTYKVNGLPAVPDFHGGRQFHVSDLSAHFHFRSANAGGADYRWRL